MARSHLIVGAAFGPYGNSEQHYAEGLWSQVPPNSLTLVDRNFLSARILLGLQNGTNRHWLLRAKSNTSWTIQKKLGRDDLLVEMKVTGEARQQDRTLPATFIARAVGYRADPSKPTQWLLTSLLDSRRYSATEVVKAYHERWEIELACHRRAPRGPVPAVSPGPGLPPRSRRSVRSRAGRVKGGEAGERQRADP